MVLESYYRIVESAYEYFKFALRPKTFNSHVPRSVAIGHAMATFMLAELHPFLRWLDFANILLMDPGAFRRAVPSSRQVFGALPKAVALIVDGN